MQIKKINVGLDAGSTTLKIVATNDENEVLFTDYNRHNADIPKALADSLERLKRKLVQTLRSDSKRQVVQEWDCASVLVYLLFKKL